VRISRPAGSSAGSTAQQAAARPDTGLLSLLSAGTYLATRGGDSP